MNNFRLKEKSHALFSLISISKNKVISKELAVIGNLKKSQGGNFAVDVLEIGPGNRNLEHLRYGSNSFKVNLTLIDANPIRVTKSTSKNLKIKLVRGTVPKVLRQFKDKSFDLVVLSHVIEHLKKEEGYILMYELDRITKFVSLISTPNGFSWQTPIDKDKKRDQFNAHLSGWTPRELNQCGYYEQFGEVGPKLVFGPGAGSKFHLPRFFQQILGACYPLFQRIPNFCFAFTAIKRHRFDSNDFLRL